MTSCKKGKLLYRRPFLWSPRWPVKPVPEPTQPSTASRILGKRLRNAAGSSLQVGSRRGRSLIFWFSSLILVHKGQPPLGSSTIELLYIVSKHGAYSQNSACSIEFALAAAPYHAFSDNITCLSPNHTLPKNTKLTIGRGAPGGTVQAQTSSTACRRTG